MRGDAKSRTESETRLEKDHRPAGTAGAAEAGGLGGFSPLLFWKEIKYFSIALKNDLTMVNGYTYSSEKNFEEPTHTEKVNIKKKHFAFRQTPLQVQTSANCWDGLLTA